MPLSGVAMTSENTAAASFSRFAGSLSLASSSGPTARANVVARIRFIFVPLPSTRLTQRALCDVSTARVEPTSLSIEPIGLPAGEGADGERGGRPTGNDIWSTNLGWFKIAPVKTHAAGDQTPQHTASN